MIPQVPDFDDAGSIRDWFREMYREAANSTPVTSLNMDFQLALVELMTEMAVTLHHVNRAIRELQLELAGQHDLLK